MKLKNTFESVDMGDEIIMVPVGKSAEQVHGVLKLNEAGREIVELLARETSEEEIVCTLSGKYENDAETLKKYVRQVVETLRSNNLIEE